MAYIDITPQIEHDIFVVRIVMTDYNVISPLVFSITCRRNDGVYQTKTLVYPEEGVDYDGNVRMFFFGMNVTHYAQIISVRINSKDIRMQYEQIPDINDDIMARYNDSITRYLPEYDFNDIKLDFSVQSDNNPLTLRVWDDSRWGILGDKIATIEIIPPGKKEPVSWFLGKNQVNIFTSVTLGINCGDDKFTTLELPDGIYDITIKGSPSVYQFNRKYLKTDLIQKDIAGLRSKANILCPDWDGDLIRRIREIETLLKSANSDTLLGNVCKATEIITVAHELVEEAKGCVDCGKVC